jgi:hypothetical protein
MGENTSFEKCFIDFMNDELFGEDEELADMEEKAALGEVIDSEEEVVDSEGEVIDSDRGVGPEGAIAPVEALLANEQIPKSIFNDFVHANGFQSHTQSKNFLFYTFLLKIVFCLFFLMFSSKNKL